MVSIRRDQACAPPNFGAGISPSLLKGCLEAMRKQAIGKTLVLALVLSLGVSGCRKQRSRDCEQFVTSVNGVLAEIDRHVSQLDGGELTNVADMRKLASLYQTLAEKIAHMNLLTPELARESQSYRTMVTKAATAANAVADALAAEDIERALSAQNQFASVVTEEDRVVQRINGYCAAQ